MGRVRWRRDQLTSESMHLALKRTDYTLIAAVEGFWLRVEGPNFALLAGHSSRRGASKHAAPGKTAAVG
jgi:hypothetical protein